MGRRHAWLSLVALAAACSENIAAPGVCPDFCPSAGIDLVDTIFPASIVRDSSYRGYRTPHSAPQLQVVTDGALAARGILRFVRLPDSLEVDSLAGTLRPVVATDSFRVHLTLSGRTPGGELELSLHRLPADVDSTRSFEELAPFFDDSTEIGAITIPDSVTTDTLTAVLPGDAFPTMVDDSLVTAVGIAVRPATPGFVNLGTREAGIEQTFLSRYAQVDSAGGQLVALQDTTLVAFDSFVFAGTPPPDPTAHAVGGIPSARALLRVDLPSSIVDSSGVVRATLILVPSEAVVGASGDTVRIQGEAVAADIGPKSPIVTLPADSVVFGSVLLDVGSLDTVRIDVTHVVVPWRTNPTAPRSLMLRVRREGANLGEFRFYTSESAVGRPALQITYFPSTLVGIK